MSQALQLQSTLAADGTLNVNLAKVDMPEPAAHEVVVQIEATPVNPSDLGVMFGVADISAATTEGEGADAVLSAPVPKAVMPMLQARVDNPLTVGNEGAGLVVAAGSSEEAQALMGKRVALAGGALYAHYRCVPAQMVMPLPEGMSSRDAASWFVNPMTALGMVETMRMEGHKALVHTAAASNLGQMLNKICLADGVDVVNIVRKPEQEAILKELGAPYVVNSSADSFMTDLIKALHKTGATLAFDATGGGELASKILTAMEVVQNANATEYSIYGSATHKQVYIYGGLDMSPSVLNRSYGMAWGVGGWLLPSFLAKVDMAKQMQLRNRVASELTTTFASHYTGELSLTDMVNADVARQYNAKTTGEKYLLCPQK